jgi:dTMP kinase
MPARIRVGDGRMRAAKSQRRGVLITFEGIEGSGKTTQLIGLAKSLREDGYLVVETREPGGTPFAERIRNLLLTPGHSRETSRSTVPDTERVVPECEACLIFAARAQHVAHVVRPALKAGAVVLCDRFADSTLAYQGYARGLDLRHLRTLNRWATGGLTPDLTLLFDLPVAVGLERRRETATQNRLDQETERFHRRVRQGFLHLATRHTRRFHRLDARGDFDAIAQKVASIVKPFLVRKGRTSSRPKSMTTL